MQGGALIMTERTTEALILEGLDVQMEQVQLLLNDELSALFGAGLTQPDLRHRTELEQRKLCLKLGYCLRLCFDTSCFGLRGLMQLKPLPDRSVIIPSLVRENGIAVVCMGGAPLAALDSARALLWLEALGPGSAVSLSVWHLVGNMFCVILPFVSAAEAAQLSLRYMVTFACEGRECNLHLDVVGWDTSTVARDVGLDTSPLHTFAASSDINAAVAYLNHHEHVALHELDGRGISAAAYALCNGSRVLYTLVHWRMRGWPMYALLQLLRVRLELEASMVSIAQFKAHKEMVLRVVQGEAGSGEIWRASLGADRRRQPPVQRVEDTTLSGVVSDEKRRRVDMTSDAKIAILPAEQPARGAEADDDERRGSLALLLQAIARLEEEDGGR